MKTITPVIKKVAHGMPEKAGLFIATAAAVVGISGSVLAYGPQRQTYTIEQPADKVTFNAITNNPDHGDERNFVQVKPVGGPASSYTDDLTVEDGKEYIVRMYVHNNAAANLNLVSKNTRLKAGIPQESGTKLGLNGYITSDNASPSKVWDDVVMRADRKFNINYVRGSAVYYNNVRPSDGFKLADEIVTTTGAKIGYESMDGNLKGCFKYSGIALFKVKIAMAPKADFAIDKKVRKSGTDSWKDSLTAQPGDALDYRIAYANTGNTTQKDVVVRDRMEVPFHKSGSAKLYNASNPNMASISDKLFTSTGVNIGTYAPKTNAGVFYKAQIPDAKDLECGMNELVNTASVATDNGTRKDTVTVKVNVECEPKECKPGIPEGDDRCNPKECKPGIPVGDERCDDTCTPKEGEYIDEDGNCVKAVTELPKTGPAEVILSLIGLAALAIAAAYWIKSRQDLKKVLETGLFDGAAADSPKLLTARTDTNPTDDKKEF